MSSKMNDGIPLAILSKIRDSRSGHSTSSDHDAFVHWLTEVESDVQSSSDSEALPKQNCFTELESDMSEDEARSSSRLTEMTDCVLASIDREALPRQNCFTLTELESDMSEDETPSSSRLTEMTDSVSASGDSEALPKQNCFTEVESDMSEDENMSFSRLTEMTRVSASSDSEALPKQNCFTELESDMSEDETRSSSRLTEMSDGVSGNDKPADRAYKRVRFQGIPDDSESDDDEDYAAAAHRAAASSIKSIVATLKGRCCAQYCVRHISTAAANNARLSFVNRSCQEQRQWVLTYLNDHHQTANGHTNYIFGIGMTRVCSHGWRSIYGITKTRFYQIKKSFEGGSRYVAPRNSHRRGTMSMKVTRSLAWLERYAAMYGDKLPDSGKIHLPSCLTKGEVYNLMKTDLAELGEETCKEAIFFRLWRKDFRHIAIPKENRFAKCDKCTLIKTSLEQTLDKQIRKELYAKRDRHINLQNSERRKYYKHGQKAKSSPEKYMSIIIDGMDQRSTALPSFLVTPKAHSNMWKLQTHITGAIVHGRGQHMFVDFKEIPHDSNCTVNVLLQVLQKYPCLPPVLYLQLDNCGRENKNKFVFALCCLLVELKIFQKIKVSFLMVGHTHEDIDQMFSRFSISMWRHKVHTLSRLIELIPQAYQKPNTTAERLMNTGNFRDWIIPCLNLVADHSRPHVFKFSLDETGKAVLHTKTWSSTGETWAACVMTTDDIPPYLVLRHPDGQPVAVKKDFLALKLDTLKKDVNKTAGHLSENELREWSNLFCQLDEESKEKETLVDFPLHEILSNAVQTRQNAADARTAHIQVAVNVSDDDLQNRQVHLGKRHHSSIKAPPALKEGRMVATHLQEYDNEWPQIGEVLCVQENTVDIHWFTGTYTRKWTPLNIRVEGKRNEQAWKTTITKSNILGSSFELTKANKLPIEVVRFLKSKFEEIYA